MPYPNAFLLWCATLDASLTSLRRNVLYCLWRTQKPLKAYDVLEALLPQRPHTKATSVYRVLDFLTHHGWVHKIESMQAYILCPEHEKKHVFEVLLICSTCHRVSEVSDPQLHDAVSALSGTRHFHWEQALIELKGVCEGCRIVNINTTVEA